QIISPWISNGGFPFAAGFGKYVNTIGLAPIPLAPFTVPGVPSVYQGTVTSAVIGAGNCGNNPALSGICNDIVLNSVGLGTTAPTTYKATVQGGLQNETGTYVASALQLQNDLTMDLPNMFAAAGAPVPTAPLVPTCTTTTPAIPAGVLTFPAT